MLLNKRILPPSNITNVLSPFVPAYTTSNCFKRLFEIKGIIKFNYLQQPGSNLRSAAAHAQPSISTMAHSLDKCSSVDCWQFLVKFNKTQLSKSWSNSDAIWNLKSGFVSIDQIVNWQHLGKDHTTNGTRSRDFERKQPWTAEEQHGRPFVLAQSSLLRANDHEWLEQSVCFVTNYYHDPLIGSEGKMSEKLIIKICIVFNMYSTIFNLIVVKWSLIVGVISRRSQWTAKLVFSNFKYGSLASSGTLDYRLQFLPF